VRASSRAPTTRRGAPAASSAGRLEGRAERLQALEREGEQCPGPFAVADGPQHAGVRALGEPDREAVAASLRELERPRRGHGRSRVVTVEQVRLGRPRQRALEGEADQG
jgi:hypothetical protein